MKRSRVFFICLLILAVSHAWGQAPSAAKPAPDPSTPAGADSNTSGTADLGPVALTLDAAVSEGLAHNLDLMAAQYNIPIAEANELTAGLPGNPSFLLDTIFEPFGANWNQTSAGGPRQFDAGFSIPLDFSNKYGLGRKDAHEATRIAQALFQDAVRQKILLLRQDYIAVVTQQHLTDLLQERADNYLKLVHVIENRIGVIKAQPLLLMRAQLARDQALIDLTNGQNALRSAKTQLAIQLGRPPQTTAFKATTELRAFEMIPVPDKETVISQALDNRPDLKALQITSDKANLDHQLAENQAWQDVTVQVEASYQGPDAASPNGSASALPGAYSWDASLNIPLPLLNGNPGLIKAADLGGKQAQRQIESLELAIRQQIGDELAQFRIDHDLIQEYEATQISNARKVRDEQQKLFGTGNMDLLDYFDAMEAYNGVLTSYYNTVGSYRNDLALIDASVGKDILP